MMKNSRNSSDGDDGKMQNSAFIVSRTVVCARGVGLAGGTDHLRFYRMPPHLINETSGKSEVAMADPMRGKL